MPTPTASTAASGGSHRFPDARALTLQAAASKAEEILAERQGIRLSAQAATAFSEALMRPAEVNERLAKALRQPRGFSWLD